VENGFHKDTERRAKKREFELIGGHPALDLVNTLDWRFRASGAEELLSDYRDLVRFVEQSRMMSAGDARRLVRNVPDGKGARVLAIVREVREAAAAVLYSALDGKNPPAAATCLLEKCANDARQHEELRWDDSKMVWELPQSPAPAALPLWLLSRSIAEFVTSDQMDLLRQCGNEECRWVFADTSKNRMRRWCDMKICGNRMKARRFKAQHK
jgi:predicted RNA-binding Zn ribbon-like protein